MAYGITDAGFVRPDFQTIRAELEVFFRTELGIPDLTVQGGKWGRVVDLLAEREMAFWDGLQAVYESRTPKGARGVPLDDLSAITGTFREGARKSRVTLRVVGTAGALVPVGFTAAAGTGARFVTFAAATVVAVPNWVTATPYALGAMVTRVGGVYEAAVAGTSGITGPAGTGQAIADGGVTWRYLGAGTGTTTAQADAAEAGPLVATAGTVTQIITAVAGVSAVSNPTDAAVGAAREDDSELRLRRENELRAPGAATADAMRSRLLRVGQGTANPVRACTVFHNDGDVPNADGLPAHSFEPVVQGGLDAEVALAVWRAKPVGIANVGAVSVVVKDAAGNDQTARFTRDTELPIYVSVTVERGKGWPTDTAAADALVLRIKQSMATYNAQLSLGERVVRNFLFGLVRVADDTVISDVTALTIGTAPSPVGTANIQPGSRQRGALDTSRINVALV